ncbi:hypothetical protein C8R43DRAFT_940993 [Mycena crocata]|nr:hypothetical protein C8R43DRAFT_940993 [Mycena crocata]
MLITVHDWSSTVATLFAACIVNCTPLAHQKNMVIKPKGWGEGREKRGVKKGNEFFRPNRASFIRCLSLWVKPLAMPPKTGAKGAKFQFIGSPPWWWTADVVCWHVSRRLLHKDKPFSSKGNRFAEGGLQNRQGTAKAKGKWFDLESKAENVGITASLQVKTSQPQQHAPRIAGKFWHVLNGQQVRRPVPQLGEIHVTRRDRSSLPIRQSSSRCTMTRLSNLLVSRWVVGVGCWRFIGGIHLSVSPKSSVKLCWRNSRNSETHKKRTGTDSKISESIRGSHCIPRPRQPSLPSWADICRAVPSSHGKGCGHRIGTDVPSWADTWLTLRPPALPTPGFYIGTVAIPMPMKASAVGFGTGALLPHDIYRLTSPFGRPLPKIWLVKTPNLMETYGNQRSACGGKVGLPPGLSTFADAGSAQPVPTGP